MRVSALWRLVPWSLSAVVLLLWLLAQQQAQQQQPPLPLENMLDAWTDATTRSTINQGDFERQVAVAMAAGTGCYNAAPIHTYELFTGADVDGHDLLSVRSHTDLAAMKRLCSQLAECHGFNSNGWFKSFAAQRVAGSADLYVKRDVAIANSNGGGRSALEARPPVPATANLITGLQRAAMQRGLRVYTYSTTVGRGLQTPVDYKYQAETIFPAALRSSVYATSNPEEAIFFFVPLRCTAYRYSVADRQHGQEVAERLTAAMVAEVMQRYPYWNRTRGADHFYVRAPARFCTLTHMEMLRRAHTPLTTLPSQS